MEILSGMWFHQFERCVLQLLLATTRALVELFVQETMDREIISPSLWKKIQQQWQDDDFFGPRGYSNELDIAPEGWGIGPGDSDACQETDELFLAASKKFESADESSEPEFELFKVASQHIEKKRIGRSICRTHLVERNR